MKKIDLHIHTVTTPWDAAFSFDLDILKRYVSEAGLDAIAITNHNVFDRAQFDKIRDALDIPVFPGVEVTLDCGHLLVIADPDDVDAFESQVRTLGTHVAAVHDAMSFDDFTSVFDSLDDYLVIPHYDKTNAIPEADLDRLRPYVHCGEVESVKKFERARKNADGLTPVLFSDCRISTALDPLPTRQTFVDCGDPTLSALKTCLRDSAKVALSPTRGLFQIFENGQLLSTGLNVVLGGRSSGKTHLLDQINAVHENVKYIEQFSLLERDEAESSRKFSQSIGREQGRIAERFLSAFSEVVDDVIDVDLIANDRAVDEYVRSLHESARELHRQDVFSKTALFNASEFPTIDNADLRTLIDAVRQLIDNTKYRDVIDEHLDARDLRRLAIALIDRYWDEELRRKKREFVNDLVRDIKGDLSIRTAAPPIQHVELYIVMLDRAKVAKFNDLVTQLRTAAPIQEEQFQSFRVVASKGPFEGAGEIKSESATKASFQPAFVKYDNPYEYLRELLEIDEVSKADIYKLFVKVSYQILNQHGLKVSGGERSEFNLLQQIKDAQKYDLLLIDEPESSFDNLFLRSDVNQLIKDIAKTMPVVVVTHNSTVGASIDPNYLVYTQKTLEGGEPTFEVYSGYPTDRTLSTVDGETISTRELTLNCLEAGEEAYKQRKERYEALEG